MNWAVEGGRIASCGARDDTQIHTHVGTRLGASGFNDVLDAIAAMDADVISMEASRSMTRLVDALDAFDGPNEIGPGVYDVRSPRVPSADEMTERLRRALDVLDADRLWVNPDGGLKTRRWVEVIPALEHMVEAARALR